MPKSSICNNRIVGLYNGKKEWVQFSIKSKFKQPCIKYKDILDYSEPLIIKNQLITDFQEKAIFFQSTPTENNNSIHTETNCLWDATIAAVDFEDQDILKIIWALGIN